MNNTGSGGAYQAENVIKVGRNRFWGFIEAPRKGIKTAQEWEKHLREEYKKVGGNPNQGRFPGFDGEIRFVDVAEVAIKLFDLRRKLD